MENSIVCSAKTNPRVAPLSRALSADPKILLIDEPTSHLDLKNQMIVFKVLVKLSREKGLAVLMTTHQPDHAMVFSNRVLMMRVKGTAIFGKTASVLTPKKYS
jgi:iron complex transport system ATP-binding protein